MSITENIHYFQLTVKKLKLHGDRNLQKNKKYSEKFGENQWYKKSQTHQIQH